jgi:EpsI family protein
LGQVNQKSVIILIFLFLFVAAIGYVKPESRAGKKQRLLGEVFKDLQSWKAQGVISLDGKIVKELNLDDYLNQWYQSGPNHVFVYVGYYLRSLQVGAAHDPLVCFPGQGWVLSYKSTGRIVMNPENGGSVFYSAMIAERGNQKELLVYWFQSYDVANADTFSQKLATWWGKMRGKGEDNAFVRISMALDRRTLEEGKEIILSFVREFYPVFLEYVRDGNENR